MKVVVLAGGISTEREVSIVTGTMVCKALRSKGHDAVILDVYYGLENADAAALFQENYEIDYYVNKMKEAEKAGKNQKDSFFGPNVIDLCKNSDIVFMALHGENGENGKVQAAFDLLGIHYTGTGYLGSALAMDKGLSKQLFLMNDVPTPTGVLVKKDNVDASLKNTVIPYPCVVKPCCGGSSIGVIIAENEDEFNKAVIAGFEFEDELVVEQYVKGREFSIGIIENKALPIIEIKPLEGFYDYANKYNGETLEICPAELPEQITNKMQELAEKVHKTLRLETYSRIDFLLDENENIYCLEANTLPGMTPTSLLPQEAEAIGMPFAELCEKLIEVSQAKYQ